MKPNPYPGLELSEDMRQQQAEWRLQRVVWPLLFFVLLAAMLGLFGSGPLGETSLETADGTVRMQYQRFLRQRAPEQLRVVVKPASESVTVVFDRQYVSRINIEQTSPAPARVIAGEDKITFVFRADGRDPLHAEFRFRPQQFGRITGWISTEGGARHRFRQFVYP